MARSRTSTQRITDLCMAINAVEGTYVDHQLYNDQCIRVRNTLFDLMTEEAKKLLSNDVSMKRLNNALHKAGWDDNYFVWRIDELTVADCSDYKN